MTTRKFYLVAITALTFNAALWVPRLIVDRDIFAWSAAALAVVALALMVAAFAISPDRTPTQRNERTPR